MTTLQKLQPIEIYQFKSQELRVVGSFEEPWFAAKDVCDILGLSNTHQSLLNVPDKWKGICKVSTIGRGDQDMSIVNEAGLYKMILRSNKPEAQPFQEWVCEQVLPGIRKKGEYVLEEYKKKLEDQKKALEDAQKLLETREETFKEILDEKETELASQAIVHFEQLEKKEQHIRKLQREKQVVEGYNCVYLCTAEGKEEEGIYTVGQTTDIEKRLKAYNDNKLFQFKMSKYISCKSFKLMDAIETILLAKLNRYKIVSNRDVFQLPEGKDVNFFTQWYDYVAKFCEDIEEGIELEERTEEERQELLNERHSVNYKIYREENKEKVSEAQKLYREDHKEEVALRHKIYAIENQEKISEQRSEYYEQNRETILEQKSEYYEANKEELALKNKVYRQENREILAAKEKVYYDKNREKELANKKKYYEVNKEEIIEKTKKYYEENKEKITERKKAYSEKNKEKLVEKRKENYEKNRAKIVEKSKEKVTCECGLSVTKPHIKRHIESQTHQNFLKHKEIVQNSQVVTIAV